MLILMLTTQFNAFFVFGLMLFFWHHNLKKPLRLTNTEVLSNAKHSAMCALGEGESLVWLPTLNRDAGFGGVSCRRGCCH